MPITDLNFTLDYCKRWGMREAVREVIQNARDVELQGGSFRVEHDARRNLLTVTSEGQHVTSRALVFGATDKADDPRTIGQFGDGLKVAIGVFLRHRCDVKINTGRELWTPRVVEREGVRCVGVTTRALPTSQHRERVTFWIGGVTEEDWRAWRGDFLFLAPPDARSVVATEHGSLLLASAQRGRVYCKGIFLSFSEDLRYGYDLPHLELNRDREVADAWDVRRWCARVWASVCEGPRRTDVLPLLYSALSDPDAEDAQHVVYSAYDFPPDACAQMAHTYRERHGDAVPVLSSDEAQQAGHLGRDAVVVPKVLQVLLARGGCQTVEQVRAGVREQQTPVARDQLTAREFDALEQAVGLFAAAAEAVFPGRAFPVVEVAEFGDPQRLGLYVPDSDRVLLARCVLTSPQLYGVLAHEVAHRAGPDGSASHREAIESIMSHAIASLLR